MSAHDHVAEDELVDLVLGLSQGPAHDAALKHLQSCEECSAAFRHLVAAHESAKASAHETTRRLEEAEARTADVVPIRGRRGAWWLAGAVAAAMLIVLFFNPPGQSPLSAQLRRMPANVEFTKVRSTTTVDRDSLLVAGVRAYGVARDVRAIADLRRARAAAGEEPVRLVYLGSALAFQGHYQEAVECLGAVPESVIPDPWRTEARWTMCVALYGAGHRAAADSLLNVLGQMDEPARNRARAVRVAADRVKTGQ